MKYKKHEKGNYNFHTIQTDAFKTIQVVINFKKELRKEEITIRNVLTDMLVSTCKKYSTRRDVVIETENLYNTEVSGTTIRSGKYSIMSFKTSFLHEKYTEEGMIQKSIAFFMELLFHPNVCKNEFDKNSFDVIIRGIEEDILSIQDNPVRYSQLRMLDIMAPDSKLSYHPTGYVEDLKKITTKSLYAYYQDMIETSIVDIFIIGDVEGSNIETILADNIIEPKEKRITGDHILTHTSIREEEQVEKEKMEITQSHLVIGCKVDELTPFERQYAMNIYSFILGGSGDSKLFQVVREQNSLCYHISASYNFLHHLLMIRAGIDKKDFDLALTLIKEQIEAMANGDFNESDIQKGIKTYLTGCAEIEDSPHLLINAYLSHEYLGNDLLEEREENIRKVNKKMIVALAKKIHIDTVYLLEGASS